MSMNVGCCGTTGVAQSQQSQKAGGLQDLMQALFNQVDGDGDGSISQTEFSSLMNTTSGNGAANATDTSDLFKSIDSDGDGQISLAEFKKFASGMFASQVDAASSSSSSGTVGGMLDKVVHAAEDLFGSVFGSGAGLPPGTTVSASVFSAMTADGHTMMVGASVTETFTQSLVNARTGEVAASRSTTQTASVAAALQSYGHHKHHGGDGGLAQLLAQLTGSDDGSSDNSASAASMASGAAASAVA